MRHLQPDHDQPITPPPPFPIILLHPVLYGCVCVSWVPINPPPPRPIILLHPVLYGCVCVSWVWSHKSDRRLARRSARWSDSGECTSRGRPSPATACGSGRGMLRRAEGPNLRKQNGLRAAGAAGGGGPRQDGITGRAAVGQSWTVVLVMVMLVMYAWGCRLAAGIPAPGRHLRPHVRSTGRGHSDHTGLPALPPLDLSTPWDAPLEHH